MPSPPSYPFTESRPTALLLIDFQTGLSHPTHFGPVRSNAHIAASTALLLSAARAHNLHIIHVIHHSLIPGSPLEPTHPGVAFEPYAQPLEGEPVMIKHVNSAFVGTDLEAWLRAREIRRLVVAGLTTDHCVSTSVRMAANLGVCDYEVEGKGAEEGVAVEKGEIILVGDATAAHAKGGFEAESVQGVSLASLDGEFARVVGVAEVLGEMEAW